MKMRTLKKSKAGRSAWAKYLVVAHRPHRRPLKFWFPLFAGRPRVRVSLVHEEEGTGRRPPMRDDEFRVLAPGGVILTSAC